MATLGRSHSSRLIELPSRLYSVCTGASSISMRGSTAQKVEQGVVGVLTKGMQIGIRARHHPFQGSQAGIEGSQLALQRVELILGLLQACRERSVMRGRVQNA